MILNPTLFIRAGHVAYHLAGDKIDDSMRMVKDCGGYKGKRVYELMRDGWTFVCSNNQFKKGQKITAKQAGEIAVALKRCNEMDNPKITMRVVDGKIYMKSVYSKTDTLKILAELVSKMIEEIKTADYK